MERRGRRLPGALVVAGAIVLGGIGVLGLAARGRVELDAESLPVPPVPLLLGLTLLAGLALVIAFFVTGRRRDGWRRDATPGTIAAVLGVVWLVVIVLALPPESDYDPFEMPPGEELDAPISQSPLPDVEPRGAGELPDLAGYEVLGLLLAAAMLLISTVVTATVLLRRHQRPTTSQRGVTTAAEVQREVARQVVMAGREALPTDATSPADPRRAVIAAYSAIEEALADAGAMPLAADTPADLLRRAATEGMLGPAAVSAAGDLAELFRRARFSTVELGGDAVERAGAAFDRIEADLSTGIDQATASR